MSKIIVGLSGGVDSAVAAYLLKKYGYEVIGITLRTWDANSRCCDIDSAREAANTLGIEYHTVYCAPDFKNKIEMSFIDSYLHAKTPNPCVVCNREIKWEWLLYAMGVYKADCVATGHYVRLVNMDNGRYTIRCAKDQSKDQTYMLYRLTQEQLSKTIFPLGELTKSEVRQIAREIGLSSADKSDSQEICFVSNNDYADFILKNLPGNIPETGNFVDINGNVLGSHKGIIHYTVGQRKGLGLSMGYPVFVKEIRAETNEVVVCEEKDIYKSKIQCNNANFLSIPGINENQSVRANVKIRYHHNGTEAIIKSLGDDRVLVEFDEPVRAPAPGQSAVFYDENQCVIGGGIITN